LAYIAFIYKQTLRRILLASICSGSDCTRYLKPYLYCNRNTLLRHITKL